MRGELPAAREIRPRLRAFRDWRADRPFDVTRWDRDMRWMLYRGIRPDFVVVPDIVAGGLASVAWSAFWRDTVPEEFPAYLAVQDGMTAADVVPHLPPYAGIFVGGSLPWKLATSAAWVQLARGHGLHCYIGRVGTAARVRWARSIGASSIDSCLPLRAGEHLAAFLAALGDDARSSSEHAVWPGVWGVLLSRRIRSRAGDRRRIRGAVAVMSARARDPAYEGCGFATSMVYCT